MYMYMAYTCTYYLLTVLAGPATKYNKRWLDHLENGEAMVF